MRAISCFLREAAGVSRDDQRREQRIAAFGRLMCATQNRALRARAWYLMRREILARSETQISRMEKALRLTS